MEKKPNLFMEATQKSDLLLIRAPVQRCGGDARWCAVLECWCGT